MTVVLLCFQLIDSVRHHSYDTETGTHSANGAGRRDVAAQFLGMVFTCPLQTVLLPWKVFQTVLYRGGAEVQFIDSRRHSCCGAVVPQLQFDSCRHSCCGARGKSVVVHTVTRRVSTGATFFLGF